MFNGPTRFVCGFAIRVAAAMVLVLTSGASRAEPSSTTQPDAEYEDGDAELENFSIRGVTIPVRRGRIIEDHNKMVTLHYRDDQGARILKFWIEALERAGWQVASRGQRGPDDQVWLTHPHSPEVVIMNAASEAGSVQLDVQRHPRQTRADAWLPASLSSPTLVPLGDELFRLDVKESEDFREVLHVAYPVATTVAAVEAAWMRALTERGWTVGAARESGTFASPEGKVRLLVWRGVGAVELNLHRVQDADPSSALWADKKLPLFGIPGHVESDIDSAQLTLGNIVRCAETHAGSRESLEILEMYDKALTDVGWKRVSGPVSEAIDAIYRTDRKQLVVKLGSPGYCREVNLLLSPVIARSHLGPTWSGDDWPKLVGQAGIIVKTTESDPASRERPLLVAEYRAELMGLSKGNKERCDTMSSKLESHWRKALRAQGWRLEAPDAGLAFIRKEEGLDIDIQCEFGVATVTLMR